MMAGFPSACMQADDDRADRMGRRHQPRPPDVKHGVSRAGWVVVVPFAGQPTAAGSGAEDPISYPDGRRPYMSCRASSPCLYTIQPGRVHTARGAPPPHVRTVRTLPRPSPPPLPGNICIYLIREQAELRISCWSDPEAAR